MAESKSTLKGYANAAEKSEHDGTNFKYKDRRLSLWKARYSYSPRRTKRNSRDFCVKMVDISKKGIVYRVEDIKQMGNDGINSALATRGKNNYSIWLYKGGAACHHFWSRHIFVRKWNALNIPTWIQYLADIEIPKMNKWYAQAATFLLLSGTGMPMSEVKNTFVKIIDFQGFINGSLKNYFSRYVTGLDVPSSVKNVLFNRYGKSTNMTIKFINSLLMGKKFPSALINRKLFTVKTEIDLLNASVKATVSRNPIIKKGVIIPATPTTNDFKAAGLLFDQLQNILGGLVRGNERKIGIPKARSKTNKLENAEEINVREARNRAIKYPVNDPLVATKPINMPNKGFVTR